ncbi:MAG: hypothetical protein K2K21_11855 [Lachnospiraceae bacterium]|nr:hypothetical protein [Lachnospiraceae bacterium]
MKARLRKGYRRILPVVIAGIVITICTACGEKNNEHMITATIIGSGHTNDDWNNRVQEFYTQLFGEWARLKTLEETYGKMYIEQIDDFDQNGQKDFAIMVTAHNSHCYGTGYIYFYMNGEKPYRFYEEDFAFGYDLQCVA